jgi:hypothetical protein
MSLDQGLYLPAADLAGFSPEIRLTVVIKLHQIRFIAPGSGYFD